MDTQINTYVDIDTVVAHGGSYILDGDSDEAKIAKGLRNQRIWRSLQQRVTYHAATLAMNKAKVAQYREQERQLAAAKQWKADEAQKLPLRLLAWAMVLAGLYYVPFYLPRLIDGTAEPTGLFCCWAIAWCLWGIAAVFEMFGSSFLMMVVMMVLPYYFIGPLGFLWNSYQWSRVAKPINGGGLMEP